MYIATVPVKTVPAVPSSMTPDHKEVQEHEMNDDDVFGMLSAGRRFLRGRL